MVADWSGSVLAWEEELGRLKARIGGVFSRSEVRQTAGAFIDGLLSGVERKTGWLMAEQAGLDRPYRMQSLLGRSSWSADALCDAVRDYVFEALGDPDGVLVIDETGFLKKGAHSVGVARQYSGTAGRIENSQVGVFLAYASRFGQSLIDRRLYLPEKWAGDAERRAKAQVPAGGRLRHQNRDGARPDRRGAGRRRAMPMGSRGRPLRRRLSPAPYARGPSSALCAGGPLEPDSALDDARTGSSKPIRERSPTIGPLKTGRDFPPAKARRGSDSTTGRGWRCLGRPQKASSAGC